MFDEIAAQKPGIGARRWTFLILALLSQPIFAFLIFLFTIAPIDHKARLVCLIIFAAILSFPFAIGLWRDKSRSSLWEASVFEKLLLVLSGLELTYLAIGMIQLTWLIVMNRPG